MAGSLGALAVGVGSGVLSGAFGIGGGLVTTPAIRLLLGRPELVAVGTPLAALLPTALSGAAGYARRGLAEVGAGVRIGAAGAASAVAGALLSARAGGRAVLVVTAVVIVYVAGDMAASALRMRRSPGAAGAEADAERRPQPKRPAREAVLGLVTGLFAGFLGLGGGFIVVPALTRFFGYPIKRALGTSLIAIAVMALPGAATHWVLGHVDPELAALLALGGVAGAWGGAFLAAAARETTLRLGFAALLAGAGLVLGLTEAGVW